MGKSRLGVHIENHPHVQVLVLVPALILNMAGHFHAHIIGYIRVNIEIVGQGPRNGLHLGRAH